MIKTHVTLRYRQSPMAPNSAEEAYEMDWEGTDLGELFKMVQAFDSAWEKASPRRGRLK